MISRWFKENHFWIPDLSGQMLNYEIASWITYGALRGNYFYMTILHHPPQYWTRNQVFTDVTLNSYSLHLRLKGWSQKWSVTVKNSCFLPFVLKVLCMLDQWVFELRQWSNSQKASKWSRKFIGAHFRAARALARALRAVGSNICLKIPKKCIFMKCTFWRAARAEVRVRFWNVSQCILLII